MLHHLYHYNFCWSHQELELTYIISGYWLCVHFNNAHGPLLLKCQQLTVLSSCISFQSSCPLLYLYSKRFCSHHHFLMLHISRYMVHLFFEHKWLCWLHPSFLSTQMKDPLPSRAMVFFFFFFILWTGVCLGQKMLSLFFSLSAF